MQVSPLPLSRNAKVLEIGASFRQPLVTANFWKDLEKIGPQLTTIPWRSSRDGHGSCGVGEKARHCEIQKGYAAENLEG